MQLTPESLAALIARLTDHVIAECSAIDAEKRHSEWLDECYPEIEIGSLTFSPSQVIRECDPTAFRGGVADMTGTDDTLREIRGDYYDEKEVEAARESFLDELREELTSAEAQADVDRIEAEIDAAERHSF